MLHRTRASHVQSLDKRNEMPDSSSIDSGVALTRISAYTTQNNLAARIIMEVMRTGYAKSGTRSQRVSNYKETNIEDTRVLWRESAHYLRRAIYFAELFDVHDSKGAFEMRHSFLHFLWLVSISDFFARKFLVHLRTVYASSRKLARPQIYVNSLNSRKK